MSAGPATTRGEAVRLRLLGLVYAAILAGLVGVSVAAYQHAFDDHVTVTVRARDAGQQLNVGGDVRMNGAIVGRVSGVETDPGEPGALVSLQIDRDAAERIPGDTVVRILPTTLFGQKYVELRSSSTVSGGGLSDGDSLAEDRSAEAVELTDVLDDLDPVLTAVRPQALAATLTALANGLEGRGKEVHATMADGRRYLRALNGQGPLLVQDLELLDRVAGQYADRMPELLATARQFGITSRSLEQSGVLTHLFGSVTHAADTGDVLLRANQRRIAESLRLARPTAELLATYSPEFSCLVQGFLDVESSSAAQIRDHSFQGHFTIGAQRDGYTTDERLRLGDLGTGPACRGLPGPPVPYPGVDLDDGVHDDPAVPFARGGTP
jgi:phospholipid/cholesterol/gamma-HCH transport system substrate-binding protein